MAELTYLIFYFLDRINTIGKRIKNNISFIFYFFYIINNTNIMIKRILYFNIWSAQDGCFFISAFCICLRYQALSITTTLFLSRTMGSENGSNESIRAHGSIEFIIIGILNISFKKIKINFIKWMHQLLL